MTVFTTDTPTPARRHQASDRQEYRVYFALIFLVALPPACLLWALSLLRLTERRAHGPVGTARRQASTITPMIFWG